MPFLGYIAFKICLNHRGAQIHELKQLLVFDRSVPLEVEFLVGPLNLMGIVSCWSLNVYCLNLLFFLFQSIDVGESEFFQKLSVVASA